MCVPRPPRALRECERDTNEPPNEPPNEREGTNAREQRARTSATPTPVPSPRTAAAATSRAWGVARSLDGPARTRARLALSIIALRER